MRLPGSPSLSRTGRSGPEGVVRGTTEELPRRAESERGLIHRRVGRCPSASSRTLRGRAGYRTHRSPIGWPPWSTAYTAFAVCDGDLSCASFLPRLLPPGCSITVITPTGRQLFTGARTWHRSTGRSARPSTAKANPAAASLSPTVAAARDRVPARRGDPRCRRPRRRARVRRDRQPAHHHPLAGMASRARLRDNHRSTRRPRLGLAGASTPTRRTPCSHP